MPSRQLSAWLPTRLRSSTWKLKRCLPRATTPAGTSMASRLWTPLVRKAGSFLTCSASSAKSTMCTIAGTARRSYLRMVTFFSTPLTKHLRVRKSPGAFFAIFYYFLPFLLKKWLFFIIISVYFVVATYDY